MNKLKYLDIFSEDTTFIHEGKKNYRTWFGTMISLLLYLACIVIGFLFGQEVYKRKKPTVSVSEEFNFNSRVVLSEWPVVFSILDYQSNFIENIDEYYKIVHGSFYYDNNGNIDLSKFSYGDAKYSRCNETHFETVKDKISEADLNNFITYPYFCLSYNSSFVFQNPYKSKNSAFYDLDVQMCDPSKTKCAENYLSVMKESYFKLNILTTYLESVDYSTPVKYYYQEVVTQMTNTFLKRNYIHIKNNKYICDDGWLLESNREIYYVSYDSVNTEVNNIADSNPFDVLWNTFESPYISSVTNRSYTKIQNLLANLGGIVNAFTIIFQVIFTHYLRYLFNLNLRKFLNPKESNPSYASPFTNNDKNKSIQEERGVVSNNEKSNFQKISSSSKPIRIEQKNKNNIYQALEHKTVNDNINKDTNNHMSHISLNNFINTKNEDYTQDDNGNRYDTGKMKPRSYFSKVEINKINDTNHNVDVNKSNLNVEKSNIKLLKQDNQNNQDNQNRDNNLVKMNSAFTKSINKSNIISKEANNSDLNNNDLSVNKNNSKNNSISFNTLTFEGIHYLKFIYYKITCNKKKIKPYNIIIKEIDKFLDFLTFCNYLKSQYEKHSINSNYDPSFD